MRKDKSRKSKKVVTIPEIKIKKTSVQKIKNLKKNEKDNQEKLRRKLQRRNEKLQKKNKIKNQKTTNKVSEINRKKRMKNMILRSKPKMSMPKGKHIFGTVKVGERGQIVIPKEARELFDINPGDTLLVLGDEEQGIAVVKADVMKEVAVKILKGLGHFKGGVNDETK